MPPLHLVHLSAAYGSRPVLRDVSLTVAAGEVVALVGPNGAGKSTLLRVISGVVRAQAGQARLNGLDLLRLAAARRARLVAVVPQMIRLPENFSVGEMVLMGRTPHLALWAGESRRDCEIAWQAMRRTEVDELADRRVDELSGGEQQRVAIARALTQQPEVLLLDEPTAHLDLKHQVAVLELIRSLAHDGGLAVLMTMHELNQAAQYADRVALLHQGVIAAEGTPAQVFTAERLADVYGVHVAVSAHPQTGTPVVLTGG